MSSIFAVLQRQVQVTTDRSRTSIRSSPNAPNASCVRSCGRSACRIPPEPGGERLGRQRRQIALLRQSLEEQAAGREDAAVLGLGAAHPEDGVDLAAVAEVRRDPVLEGGPVDRGRSPVHLARSGVLDGHQDAGERAARPEAQIGRGHPDPQIAGALHVGVDRAPRRLALDLQGELLVALDVRARQRRRDHRLGRDAGGVAAEPVDAPGVLGGAAGLHQEEADRPVGDQGTDEDAIGKIGHGPLDIDTGRACRLDGGMRVAVVVPALNEAESLPLVLADLPEVHRVVVVDNGSTDGTADVARRHGAEVVYAPRRGYGTAIQAGMNHLRGAPPDILVILDADHADPAERLQDLTGPIARDEADLVLSDRSGTAEPGALTSRSGSATASRPR